MPNYFPRYARLTHFTVFTTNLSPVHLQLWTTDANGTLSLIYSLEHVPDVANTAQTVKLPDCLNVFAGDTLGFSDITGNPSVAARQDDNMVNYPHLMKGATNGLSFQSVGLAYKFSVGAGWSSDEIC
jgi:hypothetical protein